MQISNDGWWKEFPNNHKFCLNLLVIQSSKNWGRWVYWKKPMGLKSFLKSTLSQSICEIDISTVGLWNRHIKRQRNSSDQSPPPSDRFLSSDHRRPPLNLDLSKSSTFYSIFLSFYSNLNIVFTTSINEVVEPCISPLSVDCFLLLLI